MDNDRIQVQIHLKRVQEGLHRYLENDVSLGWLASEVIGSH